MTSPRGRHVPIVDAYQKGTDILTGRSYFQVRNAREAALALENFPLGSEPFRDDVAAIRAGKPWEPILDGAVLFIAGGCGVRG